MKVEKIDRYLVQAKQELYKKFIDNIESWWKEEDLQSLLYGLLVKKSKEFSNLLHREYPLLRELHPDRWKDSIIGRLDLAILEPETLQTKSEFNLNDSKIRHAIELKFPRKLKSKKQNGKVSCYHSKNDFAYNYYTDYKKLVEGCADAKNISGDFKKHLIFFEKFNEDDKLFDSCEEMRKAVSSWSDRKNKKFDPKKFDEMNYSYIEAYPGEKNPNFINNCGLKGDSLI